MRIYVGLAHFAYCRERELMGPERFACIAYSIEKKTTEKHSILDASFYTSFRQY